MAGQRLLSRPLLPGRLADLPPSPPLGLSVPPARHLQGLRILRLDPYDKPGRGNDAGALSTEQLAWFRAELAREREQPTIVFGHHPLIVEESPLPITPSNKLEAGQVATILDDYAQTPGL